MDLDGEVITRARPTIADKGLRDCLVADRAPLRLPVDKGPAHTARKTTCWLPAAVRSPNLLWDSLTIVWPKRKRPMLQLIARDLFATIFPVRLRILVSTAIGIASGMFCWFLLIHF